MERARKPVLRDLAVNIAANALWTVLTSGAVAAVVTAVAAAIPGVPMWAVVFTAVVAAFLVLEAFRALRVRAAGPTPNLAISSYDAREAMTSPSVPSGAAPNADVHIRVHRAVSETGNAASEVFRCWLHLQAETWNSIAAKNARVRIVVRRDGRPDQEMPWFWTGIRETVDLKQGSPVAIPIAISDRNPGIPGQPRWAPHPTLPLGKWFLTPRGHDGDAHIEIPEGHYWLDVTVQWDGGSVTDWFLMECPTRQTCPERIVHTVSKEWY